MKISVLKNFVAPALVSLAFISSSCSEKPSAPPASSVPQASQKDMAPGNQAELKGPFGNERGLAWTISIPQHEKIADGMDDNNRSTLALYENGKPLGPAHSMHVDVRNVGKGAFSHWRTALIFSTSDNSDPNTNGRKYTISVQ